MAVPANETTRVCNAMHDTAMLWRKKHIDLLREILVKDRLGNQRTSGEGRTERFWWGMVTSLTALLVRESEGCAGKLIGRLK